MNKSELVAAIAEETGVSKSDVDSVLNAMFEEVISTTAGKGEKITIPGYLSFERTRRSARTARNPQTGAPIDVPATNAMKVSAGSKLKNAAKASG